MTTERFEDFDGERWIMPEATALRYPTLSRLNLELAEAVDAIITEDASRTTAGNGTVTFRARSYNRQSAAWSLLGATTLSAAWSLSEATALSAVWSLSGATALSVGQYTDRQH